jgi:hypothetical protein
MSTGRASGPSRSTGSANVTDGQLSRCTYDDYRKSIHLVAKVTPPALRRRTIATAHSNAGEAQRSPPPDLGPLPGYARARPPGCLADQVGRAAASRAGSGRLPPGGPSGKPPASPWTGHQIDRLLTQAVTSAETSTAVGARAITSESRNVRQPVACVDEIVTR